MAIPFESAKVAVNWPLQFNSESPGLRELLVHHEIAQEEREIKRRKSKRKSRSPSGQSVQSVQSVESGTPDGEKLCSRCAKIDIDRLLSKKPGYQKSLGPVSKWKPKRCSLCRFLYELLPPDTSNKGRDETYELWTFRSAQTTQNLWCAVDVPLFKLVTDNLFSGQGIPWILPYSGNSPSCIKPLQPAVNFDTFKKWLDGCLKKHGDACGSLTKLATENLKLIDCQTRLVVSAKEEDEYFALSYTWGDVNDADKQEQQQDISFLQLPIEFPETISDAIKVTQQLGYRYLWVDAYCVDRTWIDFHDQLRQMDAIYQNAVLTIIAAAGSGPRYGLPGVGHRRRAFPQVHIGQYSLSPTLLVPEIDNTSSAWATRAWTFQEGLLSTRRLMFTEDQIYFECRQHHCTEILDLTAADVERARRSSRLQGHKGLFPVDGCGKFPWDIYSRITEYTSRQLSYGGDILNGLLGVFRAFERKQHPIRHLWGVPFPERSSRATNAQMLTRINSRTGRPFRPLTNFAQGLAWFLPQPSNRREGFPSWSWTGWYGQVNWPPQYCDGPYGPSIQRNQWKCPCKLLNSYKIGIEWNNGVKISWESFQERYEELNGGTRGAELGFVLRMDAYVLPILFQRKDHPLASMDRPYGKDIMFRLHGFECTLNSRRTIQIPAEMTTTASIEPEDKIIGILIDSNVRNLDEVPEGPLRSHLQLRGSGNHTLLVDTKLHPRHKVSWELTLLIARKVRGVYERIAVGYLVVDESDVEQLPTVKKDIRLG